MHLLTSLPAPWLVRLSLRWLVEPNTLSARGGPVHNV
jgi:hypothetical protein